MRNKISEETRRKRSETYNGENGTFYGKKRSEESKKKMSLAHKGKKLSKEHKIKIGLAGKGEKNGMYGKENKWGHHTNEAKEKIGKAHKGKIVSKKTREKLSIANTGKKHSKESIIKMSIAHSNPSEETRMKMSIAHSNPSEETRMKMSNARKGKKLSSETRRKISIAKSNPSEELRRKMSIAKSNISEETRMKMSIANTGEKNPMYGKNGEKNPNWQGGKSFEPYSTSWTNSLKKFIRERDNHVCAICNKEEKQVHHIDYDKKNCKIKNLITLCKSCHSKTNINREHWTKFFQSLLEKRYGYKY